MLSQEKINNATLALAKEELSKTKYDQFKNIEDSDKYEKALIPILPRLIFGFSLILLYIINLNSFIKYFDLSTFIVTTVSAFSIIFLLITSIVIFFNVKTAMAYNKYQKLITIKNSLETLKTESE
ncbi:hypothetical protein [Photobacterium leiognathi]|uniref:hypothetical protein n=1 Tax=Photobacterium leiognathi TaxID=553611 RepID=UPI002982B106|nr:hypothetical protein [Photobacterium leiognathi]